MWRGQCWWDVYIIALVITRQGEAHRFCTPLNRAIGMEGVSQCLQASLWLRGCQ
jgi:hypothetical protein